MLPARPSLSDEPITLFISYAQEDKLWYEKLEKHLAYERRRGTIISVSRQTVPLGSLYRAFIAEQIDAAQIILLLISSNFMDSDECIAEMEQALQRSQEGSVRLIPIMLAAVPASDWGETDIGQLSPLPEGGESVKRSQDPNDALYKVALKILTVVKEMRQDPQRERPLGYRSLSGIPPLVQQARKVQRPHLVQQIYHMVTSSDISTLVLVGMGGIGKSVVASLLYDYAEQQRAAGNGPFTGKTLLLQVDATVTLADIVGTLREEWQMPALNLASMTLEQVLRELAKMLQATPCLIILNQFEALLDPQTGQARMDIGAFLDEISTKTSPSRVVMTSRFSPRVTHLATFLHEYEILPLTEEEGKALFALHNSEASESEGRLTVERCQGHALALVLVSELLKKDHSIRLPDLFEHRQFSLRRIETMAHELLHTLFTEQLNQDQRGLLSAFAVYREDVPIEAALAVIPIFNTMSPERISHAHTVLLSQYLLQPTGEKRYRSPDLISEFARQKIEERPAQKKPTLLQRAHMRAARYYQQRVGQPMPSGKRGKGFSGRHDSIEAIWHLCQAKRQREAYTMMVKENLFLTLLRWGSNSLLLELYQYLDPATWKPAADIAAQIFHETGEIYQAIGNWYRARDNFERAVAGFRALDQQNNLVDALNNLGTAYHQVGLVEEALACYEEARQLSEQAHEKMSGSGTTLNNLGYIQARFGHQERRQGQKGKAHEHYLQALDLYQQALPLHQAADHLREYTRTLNNIGEIEQMLGKDESAYTYYQQALTLARTYEERWIEATVLNNLGVLAKRRPEAGSSSLEYYKQALTIFRAIGARESERTVLHNLGYWYLVHQQHEIALACFVLARAIAHELTGDNDEELPALVLRELQLQLGEQALHLLQHDIEARAEQLVEQALFS